MQDPVQALLAEPNTIPARTPFNINELTAGQLAGLLVSPPSHLLIDCGWRLAPHPLGVSHFVTQLLKMRRRGTTIWLCNVHPVLFRCVHYLRLDSVFHLNG